MSDPLVGLRAALQSEHLFDVSRAARALLAEEPSLGGAWGEVAAAALTAGDEPAALKAALKLAEALPGHADSWLWVAACHAALGAQGDALRVLESQAKRFADNGAFQRRAGRAYLDMSQPASAEGCFRKALKIDTLDALAWEGLAAAKTFTSGDGDLATMEELRINWPEGRSAQARGVLSYALAKAYDDIGEIEASGRRVAEGASFFREFAPFDTDRHELGVKQILSIYDDRFARANEEAGALDARPVLVMAPPAAGASWLAAALAAGDAAAQLMRGNGLFWMASSPLGDHTPNDLHQAFLTGGANVLADVGRAYLELLTERFSTSARRIIDPSSLLEMAGGAAGLCLPAARFIQITREPRDLAWAIYRRRFSKGRHWSYHPDDIARVLVAHNALCARWKALFPDRFMIVSYEDLLGDPQGTVKAIARFAGLDADAAGSEAWLRSDRLASDPVGVHKRAGSRFESVEAALQRAGLV